MSTWKSALTMAMFLLFVTIITGSYYTFLLMIGWYFMALGGFNDEVGIRPIFLSNMEIGDCYE